MLKEYSAFHQIREITVKTQVEVYGGKLSLLKCTFQVIFKNVVHKKKPHYSLTLKLYCF